MAIFKFPLLALGSVNAFSVGNAKEIKTDSRAFFDLATSLDVKERQREANFEFSNYEGPLSFFSDESDENTLSTFKKYGCIKSLFGDLDDAQFTNSPVEKIPEGASSRIGCALAQADYDWENNPREPKIGLVAEFVIKKEDMGWILGINGTLGKDAFRNLNVTFATLEKKDGRWEVKGEQENEFSKETWTSCFDLFGAEMEEFYGKGEVAREFEFWKVLKNIKVMFNDKGQAIKHISTNKASGVYTEYDEKHRVARNIKAVLIEETSRDASLNK